MADIISMMRGQDSLLGSQRYQMRSLGPGFGEVLETEEAEQQTAGN
jgi:hypothetical protein